MASRSTVYIDPEPEKLESVPLLIEMSDMVKPVTSSEKIMVMGKMHL